MRFSVISLFAAAALAAPFVSAQTVQPAAGATPQASAASSGAKSRRTSCCSANSRFTRSP